MIETKSRLTKKQIKRIDGPNSAVRFSLAQGKRMSPIYFGALPEFKVISHNYAYTSSTVKIKKGIPFINTTLRN